MKTSVGQLLQHIHPFGRTQSTRMGQTATEEQLRNREQQQAAVARLGQLAFGGLGFQALMDESVTSWPGILGR